MLLNMEVTYPWLKKLLGERGISFQGQYRYPLKTSVNQRGEQTINKNAKTAGLFLSQYLLISDNFKDMFLLVRFNFICTAGVALKDLSILCPCFKFSYQVQ